MALLQVSALIHLRAGAGSVVAGHQGAHLPMGWAMGWRRQWAVESLNGARFQGLARRYLQLC